MKFEITSHTRTEIWNKHWQFCVGSGHAAFALRSDYAKQLKFIHDELGIQFVRFHGIFNDDMHTLDNFTKILPIPGMECYQERNFYLCGVAYDNILSCGMKPFVELGFMPEVLAKNPAHGVNFYGSIFSDPKDHEEWAQYIKAFIRFLLHRYGQKEVESWFFEVWNEPDLQGSFYQGTQEDYFRLYEVTVKAIKEVCPTLRVGGPATSGSKWVKRFVDYCGKKGLPLDFVSTHQYSGDPLGGVKDEGGPDEEAAVSVQPEISADTSGAAQPEEVSADTAAAAQPEETDVKEMLMSMIAKAMNSVPKDASCLQVLRTIMGDPSETTDIPNYAFRKNAEIVKQQAKGLPVYYTEWNMQATFSAYSNDTRKTAAYDVKTALDVEKNVTGSSVWCFSDIFEEFHQFKEEFHGGFGLQTIHGIPKPSFYGLKMLAQAGEERYVLGDEATDGEIGIAAFKAEGKKQVLLFRQKMKQLDLPKERAEVSIEVDRAPRAVSLQRIDEEHCNPLRIWEEMGEPADLNWAEVKEIVGKSALIAEEMPFTYENGSVHFEAELGVNDIYFVTIQE